MSETKYYLTIPYEERNKVKSEGAKWDPNIKLWYTTNPTSPLLELYQLITLQIDYKDKDNAKALGAKFNSSLKSWYCTPKEQELIDRYN